MDVFPNNCISRFVFTSRNFEVASMATWNCRIELTPLADNNSYKLFCNLAFRNIEEKMCPSELHDLATKFLQKCDGLPLAIACIGGLLSCKPLKFSEWKKVYQELELQTTKHVDSILKLSMEDLP
jgi:disease resistance protein RPM1